jgi:hypothetical protein
MFERTADPRDEAQMEDATAAAAMVQEVKKEKPTSLALQTKLCKGGPHRQRGSLLGTKDKESSVRRASFSESQSSEHGKDDEKDDDENCATCFTPLLDGDRVGASPCDHIFHAEQVWLQRRNAWPLCQTKDVATPRFDKVDHASSTNFEDSSSLPAEADTPPPNGKRNEDPPSEA